MLTHVDYIKEMSEAILKNAVTEQHLFIRERMFQCVESGSFNVCLVGDGRITLSKDGDHYVVKYKDKTIKNKQKFDCFDEAYLNFIHRAATDGISFHRG